MKHPKRTMIILAALGLTGTGCSNPAFTVSNIGTSQTGAGNYTIPPKVDVLFMIDNSGSAIVGNATIEAAAQQFLSNLNSQGWDFRFAVAPLIQTSGTYAIPQIAASAQDGNWYDLCPSGNCSHVWSPPFPGASPAQAERVDSWRFSYPDQFSNFLAGDYNLAAEGDEPGFQSVWQELTAEQGSIGKLVRSDAMLAMVVLSTGDDTSGVNYNCQNADQKADIYCNDGSYQTSLAKYEALFANMKQDSNGNPLPQLVKFYAAAPEESTCFGAHDWVGDRYFTMASYFGETNKYDICNLNNVSTMLSDLASNLQTETLSFETKYLMLNQQPNWSTVSITKYIGGDANNSVSLTRDDASNGFTYVGYEVNLPTVDKPMNMNNQTGYAIELHGSALLEGNDTVNISYLPYGDQNSN